METKTKISNLKLENRTTGEETKIDVIYISSFQHFIIAYLPNGSYKTFMKKDYRLSILLDGLWREI